MKNTLATCRFLVPCFGLMLLALAFTAVGCKQEKTQTLYVYNWVDYISEDLIKEFEKKHNCTVVLDIFDSNEQLYTKLKKAGNEGYDIIVPTTYMVDAMRREGMIQKLDLAKIPNAKHVDRVVTKKVNDEQMEYSVPYLLGFTGIGYNAEKVGEAPKSWTIFADEKFKNRMTMLADMRETIGVGLMCLGYDINTRDTAQLAEARDLILKWRPNLAKFGVDDVKNGLVTGEYCIVHQYSGDILQYTMDDPNIRFAIPEEGALFAADHLVIPANAPNADLAHKFIDFFCDPANCARNMEDTQFLAPNAEAVKLLPDELRNNPGFVMSPEAIQNAKVIEDLGEDQQLYSTIWDEINSAQ